MIRKIQRKWAGIPNFPKYIISDDGQVRRVGKACGAQVGKDLKRVLAKQKNINGDIINYYQVTLRKDDGKCYTRSLRKLVALAFSKHVGHVYELKIKSGCGSFVRIERTRLITETVGDTGDLSVENIRFNYPKRGERHPNHKLDNNVIQLIRNNLDMKLEEFISRYGKFGVTRGTIQSVLKGKNWRVRVEPFKTMTYPEENYVAG